MCWCAVKKLLTRVSRGIPTGNTIAAVDAKILQLQQHLHCIVDDRMAHNEFNRPVSHSNRSFGLIRQPDQLQFTRTGPSLSIDSRHSPVKWENHSQMTDPWSNSLSVSFLRKFIQSILEHVDRRSFHHVCRERVPMVEDPFWIEKLPNIQPAKC